jgi:hypothetical protein
VDEKNLDEEISKLKDKLSAKITERQKTTRAGHTDDDLFASAPDRAISGRDVAQLTGARRARGRGDDDDDDMMSIDSGPRQQGTKRSAAQSLSDDDDVMGDLPATSKKRRTAAAKPTKTTPASRSRQSSVSSNPPPVRKTPARNAASRAKKVFPNTERMLIGRTLSSMRMTTCKITKVSLSFLMRMKMTSKHLHRDLRMTSISLF